MLIKIGDAWIDPVRVEIVEVLYEDTESASMFSIAQPRRVYTVDRSATASVVGCRIVTYEADADVFGVTADEAALRVNRCLESGPGGRLASDGSVK